MAKFNDLLDELRCWDTGRLFAERERVLREQRQLETRELALTFVLDERRVLPKDQPAKDGVTDTTARRRRETAKKLERLPNLGNAAMDGDLSSDQLEPAADLADEDSDEEITERAKGASPSDLQRMRRDRAKPSREDSEARRRRRAFRKWRDEKTNFLCGRFELPMEHGGAIVESFFDQVAEKMRPARGEAWEPLDRRQADVLVGVCRMESTGDGRSEEDRATEPTLGTRVDVHVDIAMDGVATMCGQPLPDEWVEQARANARIHLRVVDEHGAPIADGRARTFVSEKRRRAVIRRDGRCRWPGCGRRLRLQVHHLVPSSWGGSDDIANLASVCPEHHALLIPHGDLVLEGNPNQPDGLHLRKVSANERGREPGRERGRRARAPAA